MHEESYVTHMMASRRRFENYQDATKAITREKKSKGWRREKKTALIEKMNPAWVDLSKDWYDLEPADFKRSTDRMLS
jgi:putative endonuclease